jgi:hypothetical protein
LWDKEVKRFVWRKDLRQKKFIFFVDLKKICDKICLEVSNTLKSFEKNIRGKTVEQHEAGSK